MPGDADSGARRARGRLAQRAGGRVVSRGARRARPHLRGPADTAHARRTVCAGQTPLPQARGSAAHRRAQAQQRARPGRARAAARQTPHRRRDRRRPARSRDGNRVRALRPRVRRLHGRGGHAAPTAQRRAHEPARRRGPARRLRHADAQGGDERGDSRLDHERRDDALPDRLVRRPCPVSGDRARAAGGDRPRGARAVPRGRGPAAGGRRRLCRRRLERDRHLRRVPRRRGRAACRRRGRRGGVARRRETRPCCTAHAHRSCRTRTARSPTRTRSPPVSTIPASAPSTRGCATPAAREYVGATDDEALAAFRDLTRLEGIIPALEPAHALARARELDEELVLVCLSGRGDKDLAEVLAR